MNACERSLPGLLGPGIKNCMLSNPSSSILIDVLRELCSARIARAIYAYVYLISQNMFIYLHPRRSVIAAKEKVRT